MHSVVTYVCESLNIILLVMCCYWMYTVSQKKLGHFFTAYNFKNIEQIFTKFGINHVLFMLNIKP